MRALSISFALMSGLSVACTVSLPEVPAERFACEDDAPLADGTLACPASHWCKEGSCTERLGCREENTTLPGCKKNERHCDLFLSSEVAAVGCTGGIHFTRSSTRPPGVSDCECPEFLWCSVLGEGAGTDPMASYLLAETATLPKDRLGLTSEVVRSRTCTRVCSSELDCPGSHTCRPSYVVSQASLAVGTADRGRFTVGACVPNVLTPTVSVTQPIEGACRSAFDCEQGGPMGELPVCKAEVTEIADHPLSPIGSGWGRRLAITQRCAKTERVNVGLGCDAHEVCTTGVCYQGRCALLCDPEDVRSCGFSGPTCQETQIEREIPGSSERVVDRLNICR